MGSRESNLKMIVQLINSENRNMSELEKSVEEIKFFSHGRDFRFSFVPKIGNRVAREIGSLCALCN